MMKRNLVFFLGLVFIFVASVLLWHFAFRLPSKVKFRNSPNAGSEFCVAWNTNISTPAGPKLANEIAVGDRVLSVDVATGEQVATTITSRRKGERRVGRLITPRGTLLLTEDHPVYDPLSGEYFPAKSWFRNERSVVLIQTPDGLSRSEVSTTRPNGEPVIVYDFSVESEFRNFIAEGVVVHNKTMF